MTLPLSLDRPTPPPPDPTRPRRPLPRGAVVVRIADASIEARAPRRGRTWRALLLVLAFWWGATGLLIALQRSAGSRVAALGLSIVAAAGGLLLLVRSAERRDERGQVESFLGGALLWTCVQAAFYGGWVVGLDPRVEPTAPVLARALDAIGATAYSSVLTIFLLGAAIAITHGAGNRLGLWTFATFWAVHELAKLNVFLGVVNPGTQYLPEYLAHLQVYFGPPRNSTFLAVSVGATLVATGWLVVDAVRARVPAAHVGAHRVGRALLAMVVLLAAFELAVLGVPRDLGWWDAFLALRASAAGAP